MKQAEAETKAEEAAAGSPSLSAPEPKDAAGFLSKQAPAAVTKKPEVEIAQASEQPGALDAGEALPTLEAPE